MPVVLVATAGAVLPEISFEAAALVVWHALAVFTGLVAGRSLTPADLTVVSRDTWGRKECVCQSKEPYNNISQSSLTVWTTALVRSNALASVLAGDRALGCK